MAPVNIPPQTRRPSTRTRVAAATNQPSAAPSSSSLPSNLSRTADSRRDLSRPGPGRPRKDPPASTAPTQPAQQESEPEPDQESEVIRRPRGRPPKQRDPIERSTRRTTSPAVAAASVSAEQTASPSNSSAKELTPMDIDGEDSYHLSSRRATGQRHSARSSHGINNDSERSLRNNRTPDKRQDPRQKNQEKLERDPDPEVGQDSSEGDDEDGESDGDHQEKETNKDKEDRTARAPTKRRLRSSKFIQDMIPHLDMDNPGQDGNDFLSQYTLEQQRLKTKTSAAEALSRLLRQSIEDEYGLHQDMLDGHDYELIQHTFGDIEDLNLNLTGHISASDESADEDDELTKELKTLHRQAKEQLSDISSEYAAAKKRMTMKRSAELDVEAAQIKAGTHPDLLAELNAIEERRQGRLSVADARKGYYEEMAKNNYEATCKAAHDQYKAGQVTVRKTMVDLVQMRMNRIKRELMQEKKTELKYSAAKIKEKSLEAKQEEMETTDVIEVEGYNSCGDGCSSYDSYSSSGSDCSDCDICSLHRVPSISRRASPRAGQQDSAMDLDFYTPSAHSSIGRGPRHPMEGLPLHTGTPLPDGHLYYPHETEGGPSGREKSSNMQQVWIDQLNEERRRRRRVMDREMQNRTISKKQGGGNTDMDLDLDLEGDRQEREQSASDSVQGGSIERSGSTISRAPSPSQPKGAVRSSTGSTQKVGPKPYDPTADHRPRFAPGFGPEGLQRASAVGNPAAAVPESSQSRYPLADRYGRPWDPTRPGIPLSPGSHQRDINLDPRRVPSGRPPTDMARTGTGGPPPGFHQDPRQYLVDQRYRQQEMQEAAYHAQYNQNPNYRMNHPPPPPRGPLPFHPSVGPLPGSLSAAAKKIYRKRAPPPLDPSGYQNPRGRPLKSAKVLPWVEPVMAPGGSSSTASASASAITPIQQPKDHTNSGVSSQATGAPTVPTDLSHLKGSRPSPSVTRPPPASSSSSLFSSVAPPAKPSSQPSAQILATPSGTSTADVGSTAAPSSPIQTSTSRAPTHTLTTAATLASNVTPLPVTAGSTSIERSIAPESLARSPLQTNGSHESDPSASQNEDRPTSDHPLEKSDLAAL